MKKGLLMLLFFLLFLSLACNLSSFQAGQNGTATLIQLVTPQENDLEPQPTIAVILSTPAPTVEPTAEPGETSSAEAGEAQPEETEAEDTQPAETQIADQPDACMQYGVEEFDSATDCWPSSLDKMTSVTTLTNSPNEFAGINNGMLEFKHVVSDEIYLYSFNMANDYDAVTLEATFVKIEPSSNQNGATLACHVNETGWYEARVESSGTYYIYHYDSAKKAAGRNPYTLKSQGGTLAIVTSAGAANTMRFICGQNTLALVINGREVWSGEVADMISGGGIGLGLVSFSGRTPLHIGFERVEIIEP